MMIEEFFLQLTKRGRGVFLPWPSSMVSWPTSRCKAAIFASYSEMTDDASASSVLSSSQSYWLSNR